MYRAIKNDEITHEDYTAAVYKHGWDTAEKRNKFNDDPDIKDTYKFLFWSCNMYPLYKPPKTGWASSKQLIYTKDNAPMIRVPVLFKGNRDSYFIDNSTILLQDYKITLDTLQEQYM